MRSVRDLLIICVCLLVLSPIIAVCGFVGLMGVGMVLGNNQQAIMSSLATTSPTTTKPTTPTTSTKPTTTTAKKDKP